jgi:hypothetical protein
MADADLRPMSLGEVLDRTFNLYKNNFWLFAGITAMPSLILLLISVTLSAIEAAKVSGVHLPRASGSLPSAGMIAGAVGGAVISGLLYLFLLGAAQAATVFAVSDLYLQRKPNLRNCYKRVGAKAFRVILILILSSFVVGVGFLCLIVPGIILLARTGLAVPVSMLEDSKSIRSIERSMELTKGNTLQVLVIFLMVWVIASVVAGIFEFPLAFFILNAARLHHSVPFGILLLQHLSAFVSQVLAAPIGTIAFSLMYYNLRVRKEAFDIQHLMTSMGSAAAPNVSSVA